MENRRRNVLKPLVFFALATVAALIVAVVLGNKTEGEPLFGGRTISPASLTEQTQTITQTWTFTDILVTTVSTTNAIMTNATTTNLVSTDLTASGTTTFNSIGYAWPSSAGSSTQVLSTDGAGSLTWATSSPAGDTLLKAVTATTTLTAADIGKLVVNTNDSTQVQVTLPTAVAGMKFYFLSGSTSGIRVNLTGSEIAQYGTATTTAGGYFRTANDGDGLTIVAIASSSWYITDLDGTWTYDE